MTNTEATVVAAILSAHTGILVGLAVVLGRTRERLARVEGLLNGELRRRASVDP